MTPECLDLQRRLRAAGLYHGLLDGEAGPATRLALKSFQSANGLPATGVPDRAVETLLARIPVPDVHIPPWLTVMRDHLGLAEVQGPGSNPLITGLATRVAAADPRLEWIASFYTDDAIPWCGLMEAFCMVSSGILPPVPNPLSARAWGGWGKALSRPIPGAVLVFTRPGGGHVGLYEAEDETSYLVIAGNQGDRVSRARVPKSRLLRDGTETGIRWPATVPVPAAAIPLVVTLAGQGSAVSEA